jgi:NAD(P)-dependent dehydrogenase (short-subunit alcohol dehydrogenase family)
MDLGLKGRRALVTGASKGLGKAVAAALSAEGAAVAICARDPNRTQAAAREIGAVGIVADLSVVNGVGPLLRQVIERLDGIDILVINRADRLAPISMASPTICGVRLSKGCGSDSAIDPRQPSRHAEAAAGTHTCRNLGFGGRAPTEPRDLWRLPFGLHSSLRRLVAQLQVQFVVNAMGLLQTDLPSLAAQKEMDAPVAVADPRSANLLDASF